MSQAHEFSDARWRKLALEHSTGSLVSELDQRFLAAYRPVSREARAEQELLQAIGGLGNDEEGACEEQDLEFAQALVAAHLAEQQLAQQADPLRGPQAARGPWAGLQAGLQTGLQTGPAPSRPPVARRIRGAWLAVGVAAGLCAMLGAAALWRAQPPADHARPALTQLRDTTFDVRTNDPVVVAVADEVSSDGWALEPASRLLDARTNAITDRVKPGRYRVRERTCLRHLGARTCLEAGSKVAFEQQAGRAPALNLLRGRASLEVNALTPTAVSVKVAGQRYEADQPTSVLLSVQHARRSVKVRSGSIARVGPSGRRTVLKPRAQAAQGGLPNDPKALLELARAQRRAGDRAAAVRAYAALVERYPNEPSAAPALVTLGELELARGRPGVALTWFDRYLAGGDDMLAEEAGFGAIRALKRLGRRDAVAQRTEMFLRKHPSSGYSARLK